MMLKSLERIRRLEGMSYPAPTKPPRLPGIYFVFSGAALLYVGKSRDLSRRLPRHNMSQEFIDNEATFVHWLIVRDLTQLGPLESYYIRQFRPTLNINEPCGIITRSMQVDGNPEVLDWFEALTPEQRGAALQAARFYFIDDEIPQSHYRQHMKKHYSSKN